MPEHETPHPAPAGAIPLTGDESHSPRRRNSRRGNLSAALRLALHYNRQKIRNEVYHHDLWLYRHRQHGWAPQTSTEKTVMQTVIGDMMSVYPSESYGIIFGSHGSGWLPTITGTRSIGQDGGRYSSDRSEEHTSELQSQR